MNDPVEPDHPPANDESVPHLDAALRAAFGPPSTAVTWARRGVLAALRESTGITSRISLRDEPDAPLPIVGSAEEVLAAGGQGRYQVLGEIARGGMGVVLKGRDPDLGRDVAMKMLHPDHTRDLAMIQRFIEEAQIGGQLQHPGILPVYELGLDADLTPYFTMRLVKGRTLAALLEERNDPTQDLGRFLAIFEQVCQTVAYAHARGVIHRDLKPSNILVGAFGEVQVVDWGLSKVLRQGGRGQSGEERQAETDEPQLTTVRTTGGSSASQSGSIIGTPSFMSREQALGEVDDLDERTDVFALGAVLCEILTGQPPYTGTRAEILEQAAASRLDVALARLSSCGAGGELIGLAERCLDPSPALRPLHAGVVARDVRAYLTSVGDRARAAEIAVAEARATAAAERKAGRRTAVLASALGLAVLTGITLALLAESQRRARAEHSIASVAALYHKSDWFRDQARRIPPEQLETWERALGQVRRTAEIVGAGAVDDDTRKSVARLLGELRKEEQKVNERARLYRDRLKGASGDPPVSPEAVPERGSRP
jgi:serine/threonine-protein kinase